VPIIVKQAPVILGVSSHAHAEAPDIIDRGVEGLPVSGPSLPLLILQLKAGPDGVPSLTSRRRHRVEPALQRRRVLCFRR